MMSSSFQTQTHGKWILAGEHSVLRGNPAIVFPLESKSLSLCYEHSTEPLSASFSGEYASDIRLLFFSVIEHGLSLCNHHLNHITGKFALENAVPIGSGLGASAALCFAVSKWFHYKSIIREEEVLNFAKKLEDLFHQKSSGLDLIGCQSQSGIFFHGNNHNTFTSSWQPHWYLSYSGHIGITSHCVQKVNELWKKNPELGKSIDDKMTRSVELAYMALTKYTDNSLTMLKDAIDTAYQCFDSWDLTDDMIIKHIELLKKNGAIACKPTGSGSGGYVLSLWQQPPTKKILKELKLIKA